jgi:EmrB/QacA subfamily drug resistance transporter
LSSAPPKSPANGRELATLVALASGVALVSLDASVLNVAMPQVRSDLDASSAQMQAILVSYMIAAAALTLPLAALGNRIGRPRVFLGGCAMFVLGSTLCAIAPTTIVLIVARAVQGVGAAGIGALALAILTANTSREKMPALIGIWTSVAVGAGAAGPLVGGLLVQVAGWRSVFVINIPIAIAVFLVARRLLIPENPDRTGPGVDWFGAALLAVGLGCLAAGISGTETYPFTSFMVGGLLAVAAVAFLALVIQQRRASHPLLAWRRLAARPVPATLVMFMLLGLTLAGAMYQMSLFSQDVLGASPAIAGVLALGASVALAVLSPFTGKLPRHMSPALVASVGLFISALSMAGLATLGPDASLVTVAVGLTVLGVGLALAMPTVQTIALAAAGPKGAS